MISRRLLLLDRLATLLLAAMLIVGGLLGIWWWTGDGPLPEHTDTAPVQDLVNRDWWPWASALAGIILILLGIRWIAAHLSSQKVGRLNLRGSGSRGKLTVDGTKLAGAAADAFTDALGVRTAKGTVHRDRGQLVARLAAVIEPEADLQLMAKQADLVSAQLGQVLGRDDVRCSVELKVARRGRNLPRVT